MKSFDGYLFAKLDAIGSKSEGPKYFLQQFDYKEIVVIKHTELWQEDPKLHKSLNKKVTIEGEITLNGIAYSKIKKYTRRPPNGKHLLEIKLELGSNVLLRKDTQPKPFVPHCLGLTLRVKWPYRSIWEGACPTAQIYDFSIEYKKKTLWRWGKDKVFSQVTTPVRIPGGEFHEFSEVWKINPAHIKIAGTYTARALFIASGQEVSKNFKVKIIY